MTQSAKVAKVMNEWKDGSLKTSSGKGVPKTPAGRKQALAIALSYTEDDPHIKECTCQVCLKKRAMKFVYETNGKAVKEVKDIASYSNFSEEDCADMYQSFLGIWGGPLFSTILSPHEAASALLQSVTNYGKEV